MRAAAGPRPKLKRLVLSAPRSDLERFEGLHRLTVVESFKVLHQLRFQPRLLAGVCQVKFRSRSFSPEQMEGHAGLTRVEELAQLEDGAFLAYYEGKPTAGFAKLAVATGTYLHPPLEITPKSWRITVLGHSSDLRRFLATLRTLRIHYRVQSLANADFRPTAPLGTLTEKQRETLVAAYRTGYYDVPRRADSGRVAATLGRGKATTAEHLRKAEKRLLDKILGG